MPALSTSTSNIAVANAALAKLGVRPISSFLDNSIAARTLNALYADTLEAALTFAPWRFARNYEQLQRTVDTVIPPPWTGLYQMPQNCLNVRFILVGTTKATFDVYGRKVAVDVPATSTESVFAEYTIMVEPDAWPGYFREPFTSILAGTIAMPITQSAELQGQWLTVGQTLLGKAASRDAQARTPSRLDTKLFIRNRRSGGRIGT